MAKEIGYLDELAAHYGILISDFQFSPLLRGAALRRLENKSVPVHRQLEWRRAMEYLAEGGLKTA